MLSLTHSISDVKTRLEQGYAAFSLADETAFTNAVIIALDDTQYLTIYPIIGSSAYTTIQAKDRVSLTEKETYLYWAEIHYACVSFIQNRIAVLAVSTSTYSKERLKVEGYEYEISAGDGGTSVTEMTSTVKKFYEKAVNYICLVGYNPHNLQRSSAIFGNNGIDWTVGEVS